MTDDAFAGACDAATAEVAGERMCDSRLGRAVSAYRFESRWPSGSCETNAKAVCRCLMAEAGATPHVEQPHTPEAPKEDRKGETPARPVVQYLEKPVQSDFGYVRHPPNSGSRSSAVRSNDRLRTKHIL